MSCKLQPYSIWILKDPKPLILNLDFIYSLAIFYLFIFSWISNIIMHKLKATFIAEKSFNLFSRQ